MHLIAQIVTAGKVVEASPPRVFVVTDHPQLVCVHGIGSAANRRIGFLPLGGGIISLFGSNFLATSVHQAHQVGDRVNVMGFGLDGWTGGIVTQQTPLLVQADGWDKSYPWAEVQGADSFVGEIKCAFQTAMQHGYSWTKFSDQTNKNALWQESEVSVVSAIIVNNSVATCVAPGQQWQRILGLQVVVPFLAKFNEVASEEGLGDCSELGCRRKRSSRSTRQPLKHVTNASFDFQLLFMRDPAFYQNRKEDKGEVLHADIRADMHDVPDDMHDVPLKLHLGCGQDLISEPGWINLDGLFAKEQFWDWGHAGLSSEVVAWEAGSGLGMLPSNSVEAITMAHLLMYLSLPIQRRLLAECARVLKANGVVRIRGRNVDSYAGSTAEPSLTFLSTATLSKFMLDFGLVAVPMTMFSTLSTDTAIIRVSNMRWLMATNKWDDFVLEGIKPAYV
jgi:hypothetical protein